MTVGILTIVTFLPAVGALLLLLVPRGQEPALRGGALAVTIATFVASVPLYLRFDAASADYQFVEFARWMPGLGVGYHLGIDGISLLLVLLTTLITPVALASAWHAIDDRVKEFVVTLLLLETGMIGVFVSLDLFLFYVFWEAMLIPMYFMIGLWGGGRRIYAAVKFVLYTLVGSLLMLVSVIALGLSAGTFDMRAIGENGSTWIFLGFAAAFAVKAPLWPFHGWLPDAYSGCDDLKPYQSAKEVPPLRVPAGADLPDTRNALKIPEVKTPAVPLEEGSCLDHPPPYGKDRPQPPKAS